MRWSSLLALLFWSALHGTALAADTWSNVAPGIRLLKRVQAQPSRQVIHAAKIDLSRQDYMLRATRNDPGKDERGMTASGFARSVNALVLLNGDWGPHSAPWNPVGMAIAGGTRWKDDTGNWRFFACTMFNECTIDRTRSRPADVNPRWWSAVGSNGAILIRDGFKNYGKGFDTDRNPRSALCLDATGKTLWMVVVEGRRSSGSGSARPYANGMTFDETIDLMAGFGCHDAVMQDGGGSSALVVKGTRVNRLPVGQSAERNVVNHIAVIPANGTSPSCASLNKGRYCRGSVLHTCAGGRHASGDCARSGRGCREDGNWAFCIDPRCDRVPTARGTYCAGGSVLATCVDGAYSESDCGSDALACGSEDGPARCVDPRCAGGQGTRCVDGKVATCTLRADGGYDYAESACGAGQVCSTEAGPPRCIDATCAGIGNGRFCTGEGAIATCADYAYSTNACPSAACLDAPDGPRCVDAACKNRLDATFCTAGGDVGTCLRGAYAEQDCGVANTCAAAPTPRCVDRRCVNETGARCDGETALATCEDGVYRKTPCATGTLCVDGADGPRCIDERCRGREGDFCAGDGTLATCLEGAYSSESCEQGTTCRENACVGTTPEPDADAGTDDDPSAMQPGGCDCSGAGAGGALTWLGMIASAIGMRRRNRA